MFCITFYSYKGGVGRTLALANVAAVLAKKKKRVLVVDFDLEAPGLTTLKAFKEAHGQPGVVDFVQEYVRSGIVPDAIEYVRTCEVYDPDVDPMAPGIHIDVMPAGRLDENYAASFGTIDWARLYEEQDGFLLMEELRAQWAAAGYEYVLIDSRTGLTDVGGICTRQLPDAVVAVFFPNEQNLIGLKQVVANIRTGGARESAINLIFAASRVPRLDDEHGVLRSWLTKFREELGYDARELTTIEHYDSLALLDQRLFVLERPNSGLAHQYYELAISVTKQNVEDADGVLRFLRSVTSRKAKALQDSMGQPDEDELAARMSLISRQHQDDFVVQRALAVVYHRLRRLLDAAIATDLAFASEGRTATSESIPASSRPSLHHLRVRIFTELGETEEVAESAEQILNDPAASDVMVLDALMALASVAPHRLPDAKHLPALDAADRETLVAVARRLSDSSSAVSLSAAIAEQAVTARTGQGKLTDDEIHSMQLVLIAGGRFDTAAAIGDASLREDPEDLAVLFNTAMAHWGRDGTPDRGMFERVNELMPEMRDRIGDANIYQCQALVDAVLGRPEAARSAANVALSRIRSSARRELSCWTYTIIPQSEFEQHCEAIVAFAEGGDPPEVLSRRP